MDPIMAASLFVGLTLMMPTLTNWKWPWLTFLLYIIYVSSEVILASVAGLWPFYVLAFFHGLAFTIIMIMTGVKAYHDAKGATGG
jgi:hypothetical protein